MPLRLILIIGAGALVAVTIGSSPAQDTNPPVDVAAVVERLASPERVGRVEAEQELLNAGPSILDKLPEPTSIEDSAARAAIVRIRKRLEEQRAEDRIEATRIELGHLRTLGDVAGAITAQVEPPQREMLQFTPEQAAFEIELDPAERPFWEWIDHLAAEANLWPIDSEAGRIAFRDRRPEDEAQRIRYSKAFRLVAGPVGLRPVAGGSQERVALLPLEVRAEPKLRPLFFSYAARDFTLTTSDGSSFRSYTPEAKYTLPFGQRGQANELRLAFFISDEALTEPLALKGRLTATVAAGEERFSFPLAAETPSPRELSRGGVTVRLRDDPRKPDRTAEIEIAVVYDEGGPAFESHRTWVYHNAAYLEATIEQHGAEVVRRIEHEPEFATIAQSNGGVILRYRFEDIPPDAKSVTFNYEAPTNIIDVPIDVKIEELVL